MQINCFNNTSLLSQFKKALEDDKNNSEIDVGVLIILEKYKQLHKILNSLRRSSGLEVIKLPSFKTISEIEAPYNSLIEESNRKIEELTRLKNAEKIRKAAEGMPIVKEALSPKEPTFVKINIGNKQYKVKMAYTDEEKEAGLSNRTELPEDAGMLFVWDEPEEISMWMKDTKIPLDVIFVDNDLSVSAVYEGVPDSEDFMTQDNTSFVLEVNRGSGVVVGDDLNFSPNKQGKDKMLVLNENGETQMELDGGERIFSRPNTKILIKFAKKANETNKDSDYKALGKRVFKFLTEQDNRPAEYVKS